VTHRSDPDSAGQAALSGPGIAPPPSRAAKKAQRSRRSSHAIVAVVVLVLLVLIGGALLLGTGRDPHGVRITGNGSAATPAAASSTVAQTTATNGRSVQ
jgi:hypothetical protein